MPIVETHHGVNPLDLLKNKRSVIVPIDDGLDDTEFLGGRELNGKHLFEGYGLNLGDIVSYELDEKRMLHLIACYRHGDFGWINAHKHLRRGLDYLERRGPAAEYSIIVVGHRAADVRDGANHHLMYRAMDQSYIRMHAYVLDGHVQSPWPCIGSTLPPLRPIWVWRISGGERVLRSA